jgi:addiction module RelE/StbE family toxin
MTYEVTTKPTFMTDILDFDKSARKQLADMVEDLAQHAEEPRGNTIKKLSGFKLLWRYRISDYRIIYAVRGDTVELLAAGNRRDIYDRFQYNPDAPDETVTKEVEAELFPESDVAQQYRNEQDWQQYSVEQHRREQKRKQKQREAKERLPKALTTERLNHWGIPEQYHSAFTSCKTETDLLDASAPQDIVERVLNLVYPKESSAISEEPTYVVPSGQKLIEFVEGKISQFLLNLDDRQLELVDWALQGPTMIKGGPGSGKSTVAMYRARAIIDNAQQQGEPTPDILFTTYTNALVNVSEELLSQLLLDYDASVTVKTPDSIAMSYAGSQIQNRQIKDDDIWLDAVKTIRPSFKPDGGSALQNSMLLRSIENIPNDYIAEEIQLLIEGRGLESIDDYLNAERTGRGTGLNERQRRTIWQLYREAETWIENQNWCTWGMVRKIALSVIRSRKSEYDYVIIDEAQDLTPVMLRICISLVDDVRNIFIAADMSQSIYNHRFSYSKVDDDLDVSHRTRLLKRNYRTTTEIVRGAVEIMRGQGVGDEETFIQQCVNYGPKPILYLSDDQNEQIDQIVRFIREQSQHLKLPTGAAAVLCPTNSLAKSVARQLQSRGLPATYMSGKHVELEVPEVKVLTIHTAKGLEFPVVVIPSVKAGTLPGRIKYEDAEKQLEYDNGQRRLFFVGATRSMRRLLVTGNENSERSPFLDNLTARSWNIIS